MTRRNVLRAIVMVMIVVAVVAGRALWEGRAALRQGNQAFAGGDPDRAVRYWRRAARWYIPTATHVSLAYDKLRTWAQACEESGDVETALSAWTGIRSSVRATRSFYTPFSQRLEEADQRIAVLMARRESDSGLSPNRAASYEGWHYKLLKMDHMPSVGWSVVALLGMLLWVVSGLGLARWGLDEDQRLVSKVVAYCGAGIAIGFVVWMSGLYLA